MKTTLFTLLIAISVFSASHFAAVPAQEAATAAIQGIVVKEGTTEPIPNVQITVVRRGTLASTGFSVQQVQQAVNRGAAVSAEVIQMAQEAQRGGGAPGSLTPLTATTDSGGRFTIRGLSPGEHIVRAQLEGYFGKPVNGSAPPLATTNVIVPQQGNAEARLSMTAGALVSGRIVDANGAPLLNALVQLLQPAHENGALVLVPVSMKPSDDRGDYRLARVAPGEYYVAVSPPPRAAGPRGAPPTAVSTLPVPTFYPGMTESARALPIALRGGEEKSGIDIQMKTVPTVKVSGKVTSALPAGPVTTAQGQPRAAVANLTFQRRDPAGPVDATLMTSGGLVMTANATDGTFEIPNVTPGTYDIFARMPVAYGWGPQSPPERATGPWAFGRTTVEVAAGNIDNVAVIVHPGSTLKGRVLVDGKPVAASVRLSLVPSAGDIGSYEQQVGNIFNQVSRYQPKIETDGTFAIPVVPDGRYLLNAVFNVPITGQTAPLTALPDNAYVADIRQGTTSVYDNGLRLTREAGAETIEVLINSNGGGVEGTVAGTDKKPSANATVVLVPQESRRQNPMLYKVVQSDAQGRFSLKSLAPGQYRIFAWENVTPGAYMNADFLGRYNGRGTPVTITANTKVSADLQLIPDEGSKR